MVICLQNLFWVWEFLVSVCLGLCQFPQVVRYVERVLYVCNGVPPVSLVYMRHLLINANRLVIRAPIWFLHFIAQLNVQLIVTLLGLSDVRAIALCIVNWIFVTFLQLENKRVIVSISSCIALLCLCRDRSRQMASKNRHGELPCCSSELN